MALPITPAQQEMLRGSIAKYLRDRTDHELLQISKAMLASEAKFRDAIAIPCHNAEPHDT